MVIKYLGDESTGIGFEIGEIRTVVPTNEDVEPEYGFYLDEAVYTCTLLDSEAAKLPTSFLVDLEINGTLVKEDIALSAEVYSQATGLLTLAFIVPNITPTSYTIKLKWETQTI